MAYYDEDQSGYSRSMRPQIIPGVQYVPEYDPAFNQGLLSIMSNRQKDYNDTNQAYSAAMAKMNEEQAASAADEGRRQELMTGISGQYDAIKNKYNGDLAAAQNDVVRFIGNMRNDPYWNLNKMKAQRLDEERKMLQQWGPKALQFKSVVNTPIYDAQNKSYTSPDKLQSHIEEELNNEGRADEIIRNSLQEEGSKASLADLNKVNSDQKFIELAKKHGIFSSQVVHKAANIVAQYKNTPEYDQQLRKLTQIEGMSQDDAETKLQDLILTKAKSKIHTIDDSQILNNPEYISGAAKAQEDYNKPRLVDLENLSSKNTNILFKSSRDVLKAPNDESYAGVMKKQILAQVFPEEFIKKAGFGTSTTTPYSPYLKTDANGKYDPVATYEALVDLASPFHDVLHTKKTDREQGDIVKAKQLVSGVEDKINTKIATGDYAITPKGFDQFHPPSAKQSEYLQNYMNDISPDKFTFETGKFAGIKSNKLATNKDFVTARKDKQFKITGIIKVGDQIKYSAEDGSGEPQIVSTSDDKVNRNLLRAFGSPEHIATYYTANYKLTNGNEYFGPDGTKKSLPGGLQTEVLPNGKYYLKDAHGRIQADANNRPIQYDKSQIIDTFEK